MVARRQNPNHIVGTKGPSKRKRVNGKQPEGASHAKEGKVTSRARRCKTCCSLKKDGPRHKHDHPSQNVIQLSDEQRKQFENGEDEDTGGLQVFTFGKHKGKSLAPQLLRSASTAGCRGGRHLHGKAPGRRPCPPGNRWLERR